MNADTGDFIAFLKEQLHRHNRLPSQMADDLGISHSTISRWLSGKYIPSSRYCQKLSEYSSTPLDNILAMVGYIPENSIIKTTGWPEFREYASKMYPEELDEDTIALIEDIIDYRRQKKYNQRKNR